MSEIPLSGKDKLDNCFSEIFFVRIIQNKEKSAPLDELKTHFADIIKWE